MKTNKLILAFAAFAAILATGCRPYGAPDLVEVTPSQTAFVIPLDQGTANQEQLKSVEYLKNKQVAAKRIEVPKRFRQTGYTWWTGQMIPTMRVIVVERKPVTRNWKDIAAEDNTSIGFEAEITVVAVIPEDKAATYLYHYNNKPLEEVMDQEIKSRISGKFVEQCATKTLNQLFTEKAKIMTEVRSHVVPYFAQKGIEITNLDLKGNLALDSEEVQTAIDAVFAASQKRKEQEDLNAAARAKAQSDREIAAQLSGPMAIKLRELELKKEELALRARALENQKLWIEAWNKNGGKVPQVISGAQGNNFLFQMPELK